MFIEYMALKDKDEAEKLFDASVGMQLSEKDEIRIAKAQSGYQAVLKIKKFRNKITEQKWDISLEDKGISAKRVWSKEYCMEIIAVILSGLSCMVSTILAFVIKDMMTILLWLGLVFLFCFMFISWKKLFKSSVALKIYLIRMI